MTQMMMMMYAWWIIISVDIVLYTTRTCTAYFDIDNIIITFITII